MDPSLSDATHGMDEFLLDERGLPRALPSAYLESFGTYALRLWAHVRGVYQFPTTELIEWLREEIGGESAIEIAAGTGSIGRALGIRITDSRMQENNPVAVAYYRAAGQPTIKYPDDVEAHEAWDAVRRFKPHTVIGAWVTQLYREGDRGGNMFGVNEERILDRVQRYILIGNLGVHRDQEGKRILARPHRELTFPWLVSRAARPELDRIFVWEKGDGR